MHPEEHVLFLQFSSFFLSLPHLRPQDSFTLSEFMQVSLTLQNPETKSPLPAATSPAGGPSQLDGALICSWMSGLSRGMRLRVHDKPGIVFSPLAQPLGLVQNTQALQPCIVGSNFWRSLATLIACTLGRWRTLST